MSDSREDTEDSCGEEEVEAEWKVTDSWLISMLEEFRARNSFRQKVILNNYKVSPGCSSSENVLSEIIRVEGRYFTKTDDSECLCKAALSIIIKRLPKDPFSRFFVTEGQFDLREIKFYTQVLPDLKAFQIRVLHDQRIYLKVPLLYHSHYSPAGGTDDNPTPPESMIVLDDLSSSGYKEVEFSKGLSLAQAEVALKAIAEIHAHSLSMKVIEGKSLSECYPFLFQTTKATDSYQQLVERGLPQLARFLETRPGLEEILEALLILRPKTKDIISALLVPEGPLALITHTDFWCNNLLFGGPENHPNCSIIDWQMVTYSKPTNDIALLLISSVPTELRRKHTDSLLDVYWKSLTQTCTILGVNIPKDLGYTRNDLDKDYRKSQLLALLLCIGSVDVAMGNPSTEQRLIDVLQDLYDDGLLTDETILTDIENTEA